MGSEPSKMELKSFIAELLEYIDDGCGRSVDVCCKECVWLDQKRSECAKADEMIDRAAKLGMTI